ncbi:MAG: PD40 domain-containing protein [Bacteroidales bacterium]|nr:PD40 domain-containing protein [Bacteroidales bacterium]
MKRFIYTLLFSFLAFVAIAQTQTIDRLFRFPDIHGKKVVFTYSGDLYLSSTDGGVAKRLTSHNGYEMFAHFSPDGKQIAFTGQYDGNTEVFVIPTSGGEPKRLTRTATLNRDDVADRMGPNNIVMGWTPNGKNIIYRSRKQSFNSFVGQLYSVPSDGGLSAEIPLSSGGFCSYSPDGNKLAFSKIFREFRTWKHYQGGMAPEIYIFDFKGKTVKQVVKNIAQDIIPMWIGTQIYFISDRDRTMNLFSYNTENEQVVKLTQFEDYDIKFPGFDNEHIIFEKGGFLFIFNVTTQEVKKLNIAVENDFLWGRNRMVDASDFIANVSLSAAGSRVLISARGDIFNVPVKEGVTYNLTQSSGAHDRNPEWSPNGEHIAWISDMGGEFEIYLSKADAIGKAQQLTKNTDNYIFNFSWSPDSKKILWNNKKMELNLTDVESGKTTLIAKSNSWEITDFSWSPDSRWIAYSDNDGKGLQKIWIYNLESQKAEVVTDGWYASGSPFFTNDCKYLIFTSSRSFNPMYSATEWNVAYHNMNKIYLIPLQKSTASPFENQDISEEMKEEKTEESSKTEESKMVEIDFDGITNRHIEIPVEDGNYWNLNYYDGLIFYNFHKTGMESTEMKAYNLKEKKEFVLAKNTSYQLSSDYKKMLISQGKRMQVVDVPKGKTELKIDKVIAMNDMMVNVDVSAEWKQIYDEAWRQMRDFLYAPNMHGVDWPAMQKKYAALLPYVNHRNDLTYLIGELIGELNVGHAYINGGDRPEPQRIKTGLLGAKISKDANGNFKIEEILQGENFRSNLRSPLTEIGLNVKEGDFIMAINDVESKNYTDIYEALAGKANIAVKLTISSNSNGAESRDIIVKPIADEAGLYYYNWVQENIRKVDEATNGQVGYIHIPDMGVDGLNEFMKHFYPQLHKKALIIDDRGNGGGNVSPMIIERLSREIIRANAARNQTLPTQTPRQMLVGPTILLINQYSASDGDLFPYAYKKHKLGTVVGMRSWGGVIGIRGSLPFVDGADLRKPEFGTYAADGSSWIIEGYGVDPDVVIDNDPAREYQGIDDQLNKAIELILKEIKDYQPIPNPPAYPDKTE